MLSLATSIFHFSLCFSLVAKKENTIPERHFTVSCNAEKNNIKMLALGLCFWKASTGVLLYRLETKKIKQKERKRGQSEARTAGYFLT